MPTHDLARVLREYTLEPLRRELRASGARVLVVDETTAVSELRVTEATFDAAWIQIERAEDVDLRALARGVTRVLRPGGRLVCVVPGAWPFGRVLARALRGQGDTLGALPSQVDGTAGRRLAFSDWRRAFRPEIAWRRSRGLGVLVPPASAWPRLHPLTLGLLATIEDLAGSWPLVRSLGDWAVHEGVRR